jgi:hypothetical protein
MAEASLPQRIRAVVLETIETTALTPGLAEVLADRITGRVGERLEDEGVI